MVNTIEFVTVLGAVIGSFIYIITELRSYQKEIKEDIKKHDEAFLEQTKRTDKLYEMFISLLKDRK